MKLRKLSLLAVVIGVGLSTVVLLLVVVRSGSAAALTQSSALKGNVPSVIQASMAPSQSTYLFLPLLINPYQPKPLGSLTVLSGPTPCVTQPSHSSGVCTVIRVTCPGGAGTIDATLKIGASLVPTNSGTVFFAGGYDGTYFWEGYNITNTYIISDVRLAGFQVVQIKWSTPWFRAQLPNEGGMAAMGCRPATAARWVYDNLHLVGETNPYCAVGHSNGATQMTLMLTHYGLDNIFDELVLESGPNFSRLNYFCINTPGYAHLFGPLVDRQFVDRSFGIYTSGPCESQNPVTQPQWLQKWTSASISSIESLGVYSHTLIAQTIGMSDTTHTRYQADDYFSWLQTTGTPLLTRSELPNVGHSVTAYPLGAAKISADIINGCIAR